MRRHSLKFQCAKSILLSGIFLELQQNIGVQNAVLHTLQKDDGIIVKVALLELYPRKFSGKPYDC